MHSADSAERRTDGRLVDSDQRRQAGHPHCVHSVITASNSIRVAAHALLQSAACVVALVHRCSRPDWGSCTVCECERDRRCRLR